MSVDGIGAFGRLGEATLEPVTDVAATTTDVKAKERGKREIRTGAVVSDKCDKTVKVRCEYIVRHPKYGKYIRKRTKFGVHDERNECGVGDLVEIAQCRPISKSKSHRLIKVIKKAEEK